MHAALATIAGLMLARLAWIELQFWLIRRRARRFQQLPPHYWR